MTTQFPDAIADTTTTLDVTAERVTAPPARPFSAVFRASASAVIDGAEAAASRLPGGPLVSAALRQGSPGATDPLALGTPSGTGLEPTAARDPLESAMQAQAETSMQLLLVQNQIQEETRHYTAVSNVLKARHETMKNAIGNIR